MFIGIRQHKRLSIRWLKKSKCWLISSTSYVQKISAQIGLVGSRSPGEEFWIAQLRNNRGIHSSYKNYWVLQCKFSKLLTFPTVSRFSKQIAFGMKPAHEISASTRADVRATVVLDKIAAYWRPIGWRRSAVNVCVIAFCVRGWTNRLMNFLAG